MKSQEIFDLWVSYNEKFNEKMKQKELKLNKEITVQKKLKNLLKKITMKSKEYKGLLIKEKEES